MIKLLIFILFCSVILFRLLKYKKNAPSKIILSSSASNSEKFDFSKNVNKFNTRTKSSQQTSVKFAPTEKSNKNEAGKTPSNSKIYLQNNQHIKNYRNKHQHFPKKKHAYAESLISESEAIQRTDISEHDEKIYQEAEKLRILEMESRANKRNQRHFAQLESEKMNRISNLENNSK